MVELPTFQPWVPWQKRDSIVGRNLPGVYLLGQFGGEVPSVADLSGMEIVYIGETCDQKLESRWYQFNRSAFLQKNGHSGGWTFASIFCDEKSLTQCDRLYVAAYPVDMDTPRRSAHIRFVERLLIWTFVDRHNRLPLCNSK